MSLFGREPPIAILDGMNIVHKSYFIFDQKLKFSSKFGKRGGTPTGIIFGVTNAILGVRKNFGSTNINIAWDYGHSGRKEVYSGYKSGRVVVGDFEEKIMIQLEILNGFLPHLGVHSLFNYGTEADDVIASYIAKNQNGKNRFLVVSNDKDFLQLLSDRVRIWNGKRLLTSSDAPFGLTANRAVLFKAYTGDSSDTIKGLNSFLRKKGEKLLGKKDFVEVAKRFPSLEALYHSLPKIEDEAVVTALTKGEKRLRRNYGLVKLKANLPYSTLSGSLDLRKAKEVLAELGMKSLVSRLDTLEVR